LVSVVVVLDVVALPAGVLTDLVVSVLLVSVEDGLDASTFTVVLLVLGGVVAVVVVEEDVLPVAGAAVGASAGFTSTLVLEDDEGGVTVSVFVQPTTPTPTARRAARRYDDFIFRFPSFGGWIGSRWPGEPCCSAR
jgi:hypothetical protein